MRRALTAAVVILAVAAPVLAQSPRKDDSLQSEQRRLRQTEQQIRDEKRKAAEAKARETSVLAELEQVERRLADKRKEIARLDVRISRTQAELGGLRSEIHGLQRQRSSQEEALGRRLRAMYKMHVQGGALPMLLSGDDPVARTVAVRHLASLAALDARLIQEYRGTSDRLDDRRRREETRQRELADLKADAQREKLEADRDAAKP